MLTISLITSFLSAIFGGVFLTWYALYAKKNNKNQWPNTYSSTYSLWYEKLKKKYVMWGLYCSITCICFIWPAFVLSTGWLQSLLAIIAMTGLFMMGCFPSGKDELQTKIHCAVVQVSIWSTLAWCLLHSPWWLTPAAMVLPFIPYFVNKITKKIPEGLIVEYSAFLSVFLYLAVYSVVALF